MAGRNFAEQSFQITVCDFLALNGLLGVAVPNEGERSRGAAGRMKAAGLKDGFQDLLVFDRRSQINASVNGVAVALGSRGLLCLAECKKPRTLLKRGGLSKRVGLRDDQTACAAEMRSRGVRCFGPWDCLEDVVRDLEKIGVTLNANIQG